MNIVFLIIVGIVAGLFPLALILSSRSLVARVVASIIAIGVAAFCAFGFLASLEPSDSPNWPWQLGYGFLGVVSLCLPAWLFLRQGGRAR